MVNSNKLGQISRRWMKAVGMGPRRVFSDDNTAAAGDRSMPTAGKGNFVVYTDDGKRFVVPLRWLGSSLFGELLKMAEDEFGLPGDGPIVLPFGASFMEEVARLMRTEATEGSRRASSPSFPGACMRVCANGYCHSQERSVC